MRTSYTPHGISSRLLVVAVLVCALALGAAGCKKEPELRSYGDTGGIFHFKVPENWHVAAAPGAFTVRASDELPSDDKFDALSFLILTGSLEEDDLAEKLTVIIEARATQRQWQEYEVDDVEDAIVGNRIAFKRHVSGVDQNGVAFRADYVIVRTSGKEVLVAAMAPADRWDEDYAVIEALLERQWYWHIPDPENTIDGSTEDTATPDGDEAGEDEGVEGDDEGTEDSE